jgi:uncharacterized 2Fe-2S/4Fe-4S cluster protein (DUF4445 family)
MFCMDKSICMGECLFGKCPFGKCKKLEGTGFEILTDFHLPRIDTEEKEGLGIAVDIGTTTIAVLLYSARDGVLLSKSSALNPQYAFGLDVISRIKYCGDHPDGLKELHDAVTTKLNELIVQVCTDAGMKSTEIGHAVITGNTTMLHILCNISPVSMSRLPFEPLSHFGIDMTGKEVGLDLDCACYLPPCPSAFIGADITCGMLFAGFDDTQSNRILVDIGTNGEVALLYDGSIYSTSTAAGPAFEGAHISHGMGAVGGAINKVYAMDGILRYETIFGESPKGICGSGLLDAIAVLTEAGAIDETGRILKENSPYITEYAGLPALRIAGDIILTQKDIREFQTAKAATAAGILTLAWHAGVPAEDISTLYIAGGFGNHMDTHSAVAVGLIPADIDAKSIGNAALAGAAMLLLDDDFRDVVEKLAARTKHIELGNSAYFTEKFIACMSLEKLRF